MPDSLMAHDNVIYQEMMSHPALFSHPRPKSVAIMGDDNCGILKEILKHTNVTHVCHLVDGPHAHKINDKRVDFFVGDFSKWLASIQEASFDVIINSTPAHKKHFANYFSIIKPEGMLIQQSDSPFQLSTLKSLQKILLTTGFTDIHFISFPQPDFPTGWRTALAAIKSGNLRRVREKDIFNKTFSTHYYNFDVHKASLVLPEFMRKELEHTTE